jgi:magnesium transporter
MPEINHYSFVANEDIINQLEEIFVFHPIVKWDLLRKNSHPKLGFYSDHIFFAFHVPQFSEETWMYQNIEVDLVITNRHLFVGYSENIPWIDEIIKNSNNKHPFEVMYIVLKTLYEHIFTTLDIIDDNMVEMHDELFVQKNIRSSTIQKLYIKKSDLILFKHNIDPQNDLLEKMINEWKEHFPEIISDLQLHLNELQSTLEKLNIKTSHLIENISALAESYNQLLWIRSNKIMTSLTVVSAIFIPFSFITWVFGMNFTNIPLTAHADWFWMLLSAMFLIAWIILYIFKRQWLFDS